MFTLEADTFTSSGIAVLPKNGTLTFSTGIALITKLYIPVDKSGSLKSNSYTLLKKKNHSIDKKNYKKLFNKIHDYLLIGSNFKFIFRHNNFIIQHS